MDGQVSRLQKCINSAELSTYWNDTNLSRANLLGDMLFPAIKTNSLTIDSIKGASGIPKILKLSTFDAHVIPRPQEVFNIEQYQMPFFKESKYIDEVLRRELLILLSTGRKASAQNTLLRIYNQSIELLAAAAFARERMRMQLITTGIIALKSNGVEVTYDYGLSADQKIALTKPWDSDDIKPLQEIQKAINLMQTKSGASMAYIVMNQTTLLKIMDNKSVKSSANPLNPEAFIGLEESKNLFRRMFGTQVIVYDKSYKEQDGTTGKYIPDNIVVILPSAPIGNTFFGATPEEIDLMSGSYADVSIADVGVAVTTMPHRDPVNIEVKVSQITLPSFDKASEIVIIDGKGQ